MQNMADSATLTDYIQYCSSNYAADHYGLVLWDHGGGVVGGYGYDENFDGDSTSLTELSYALGDAGVHLDMLGFDACLMANFETCLMAAPYADYLIASEEPEPGYKGTGPVHNHIPRPGVQSRLGAQPQQRGAVNSSGYPGGLAGLDVHTNLHQKVGVFPELLFKILYHRNKTSFL